MSPLLLLTLTLAHAQLSCNCVGCQRSDFLPGSLNWCRCCSHSFLPHCLPGSSSDLECYNSVFRSDGCLSAGFPSICSNSTSTLTSPLTSPRSTLTSTLTSTPTSTPISLGCNCVGCQRPDILPNSRDWCRCCSQSSLPHCQSNSLDTQCQNSVFSFPDCLKAGFNSSCSPSRLLHDDSLDFNHSFSNSSPSSPFPLSLLLFLLFLPL